VPRSMPTGNGTNASPADTAPPAASPPARASAVLLAQSDPGLRQATSIVLEAAGYEVHRCATGDETIDLVHGVRPNLVLLDLATPPLDSLEVCRQLRGARSAPRVSRVPIILLGERCEEIDAIVSLEVGADEYLCKPVGTRLLLAYTRALLRRAEFAAAASTAGVALVATGDLKIDLVTHDVFRAGQRVSLSPREFDLLAYFAGHQGQVVTREQLLTRVWGYQVEQDTNSLEVHLNWLRSKIEPDPSHPIRLRTMRGRGYIFTG